MSMERTKLSDQIRRAIEKSGLSGYRIAKETGISQSMISVFMSGKGMLSMKFLDRVADLIGLNIALGIDVNEKGTNLRAAQMLADANGGNGETGAHDDDDDDDVAMAPADALAATDQSSMEPQPAPTACETPPLMESNEPE